MATNYSMLKESQSYLFDAFKSFFKKVIENQELLYNRLVESDLTLSEIYDETAFLEEQVNLQYSDMIDECMWTIQKDQPRAGYLRFFIAVINSVKDLERISDHAEIIADYFLETTFTDNQKNQFLERFKDSIDRMKILYSFFKQNNISADGVEEIKRIRSEFFNQTNNVSVALISHQADKNDDDSSKHIKLILMFRHIERNIEHCINIIQNFGNIHITSK
ncbi:PhoU domain-containing protein [Ureaplasma diversum]|uniref:Phosphate transport system regulator PhoU n=1 Tax=Ureaplasma diversum NCTC 246 TaxID=1188241 RepID=A0A084EXJ7_9BACT|nr:PhoU domain-containing protein [Ureaplasma diversum]KEZ22689.1 Phosphate transport system regulator PhoU [Ureaplasma diversum NCTC 246]